jgi:hypothetical protein
MIAATFMNLATKHQRLAALRPLSPESVASIAQAWHDISLVIQLAVQGRAHE